MDYFGCLNSGPLPRVGLNNDELSTLSQDTVVHKPIYRSSGWECILKYFVSILHYFDITALSFAPHDHASNIDTEILSSFKVNLLTYHFSSRDLDSSFERCLATLFPWRISALSGFLPLFSCCLFQYLRLFFYSKSLSVYMIGIITIFFLGAVVSAVLNLVLLRVASHDTTIVIAINSDSHVSRSCADHSNSTVPEDTAYLDLMRNSLNLGKDEKIQIVDRHASQVLKCGTCTLYFLLMFETLLIISDIFYGCSSYCISDRVSGHSFFLLWYLPVIFAVIAPMRWSSLVLAEIASKIAYVAAVMVINPSATIEEMLNLAVLSYSSSGALWAIYYGIVSIFIYKEIRLSLAVQYERKLTLTNISSSLLQENRETTLSEIAPEELPESILAFDSLEKTRQVIDELFQDVNWMKLSFKSDANMQKFKRFIVSRFSVGYVTCGIILPGFFIVVVLLTICLLNSQRFRPVLLSLICIFVILTTIFALFILYYIAKAQTFIPAMLVNAAEGDCMNSLETKGSDPSAAVSASTSYDNHVFMVLLSSFLESIAFLITVIVLYYHGYYDEHWEHWLYMDNRLALMSYQLFLFFPFTSSSMTPQLWQLTCISEVIAKTVLLISCFEFGEMDILLTDKFQLLTLAALAVVSFMASWSSHHLALMAFIQQEAASRSVVHQENETVRRNYLWHVT